MRPCGVFMRDRSVSFSFDWGMFMYEFKFDFIFFDWAIQKYFVFVYD